MPDQIDHAYEKFEAINTLCDEIVYLYRRDFDAQAKSWIAWNLSDDHEHHWGEEKEFSINATQPVADVYSNQLIENYKFMKTIYKISFSLIILVGIIAISLPSLLTLAGLHPKFDGETFNLDGKKALIIATNHGVLNKLVV